MSKFVFKKEKGIPFKRFSFRETKMDLFTLLPLEIQKEIIEQAVTSKNLLALKLVSKRFKKLVEQIHDPNEPEGKHLKWNVWHGHQSEVARLLSDERILSGFNEYKYFHILCASSDIETIKFILGDPRVDPNIGTDPPIVMAYYYNSMDVVKTLLSHPRVDLQHNNSMIFRMSCYQGYSDLVKLLLSRASIPFDSICEGIKSACRGGNFKIFKLLFSPNYSFSFDLIQSFMNEIRWSTCANEEILAMLIAGQFDAGERVSLYKKAFHYALEHGFLDTMKRLVKEKDIFFEVDYIQDFGWPRQKKIDIFKLLLHSFNTIINDHYYKGLIHLDDM